MAEPLDPAEAPHTFARPNRLRSLDALRGFDLFWIIGGDEVITELGKLVHRPHFDVVAVQFSQHVEWVGFRYYDMIFPLFLFIIGVAVPFALGGRLTSGEAKANLLRKVLRRTLILFCLGLVYNGLLKFEGWDHLRYMGVLPRLAIGYCVASLLFLYTKPRTQIAVGVGLVLVYSAILMWLTVPGHPLGSLSPFGNAANYVDRLIMQPGQMYEKYGDPEGFLSTLPAICTALLGVAAGRILKSERTELEKVKTLVFAGLGCLAAGLAWSPFMPVIKKIWTGSYVGVAGGFSFLLLALFYFVIDVKGWWKWSIPLGIIGSNAILIYMLSVIVDFGSISKFFFAGALAKVPAYQPLGLSLGALLAEWLVLLVLYRNRIYFRV